MADDGEKRFKFRAFLSYSRKDEPAVRKLHRRLESFQIPKLFRTDGARLGRFFRDKDELGATAELGDALNNNINTSEWLIVCCSPAAAGSHWVNEEIKAFIATHGHERVLAAVLEGEPHDSFPPVLKEREPLAADFRKTADGEDLGFLKLVAGILGVDLGELRDRQAAAERARARTRAILASVFALLAVAASVSAVIAVQQRDRAQAMAREAIDIGAGVVTKADDLSRKFGVPTSAVEELMNFADERFTRLFKEGVKTQELERQRAGLLTQFAELYGRMGETAKEQQKAQAAIAFFEHFPPDQLRTLDYVRALAAAGQAELAYGQTANAIAYTQRGIDAARAMLRDIPDGRLGRIWLAGSLQRLGEIYMNTGEYTKALPLFVEMVPLLDYAYKQTPNDDVTITNLITGIDWLGSAQDRTGDKAAALATFARAEAMARDWLKRKPDSLPAQSSLGNSLMKIGQTHEEQGDSAGARGQMEESLAIARHIAAADSRDADAQRQVPLRMMLLADILVDLGQPSPTLMNDAIDLGRAQVKGDPQNAQGKQVLANMLGVKYARLANSDPAAARATAYEIVDVRRALKAAAPPGAPGPAADLAYALETIGDVSATLRDLPSMLSAYGEAAPLRREALAASPADEVAQANLASELQALGLSKKFTNENSGAIAALGEAAKIRTTLAKSNTDDAAIAFAAVDSWQQLAVVQAGVDGAATKASFKQAETILIGLVKAHPDDARYAAPLKKTREMLKLIEQP